MFTRCFIGWHLWIDPDRPEHFGDRRTCGLCGVVHELVQDYGGWTGGYWETVEDD